MLHNYPPLVPLILVTYVLNRYSGTDTVAAKHFNTAFVIPGEIILINPCCKRILVLKTT